MNREWKYTLTIKHLLTDSEEPEEVRKVANAIADILETTPCMRNFIHMEDLRDQDDVDEVNHTLGLMYDYCDARRILVK